jgi:NAD(P)-dependent dehydrogenase (short-subunit alcohol dehydrogenase family)
MVAETWNLAGKVVIITGGGTGLGKAMALTLAKAGADVVVAARRVEPLEQTAAEVRALGRRALAVSTDVTVSQQVNNLVARTISEMGKLDIMINNAGIVRGERRKQIWDITDEEWYLGVNTNLTGAFFGCRAVSKFLATQKKGKIINTASGEGLRGVRDQYMYPCAKGGVVQLTRSLALSLAADNVQVNCIVPGFIDTRTLQPGAPTDRPAIARNDFIPVGRLGIPTDISSMALFLASDASDYVTGGIFVVDGSGLAGGYATTGYAPIIPMEED